MRSSVIDSSGSLNSCPMNSPFKDEVIFDVKTFPNLHRLGVSGISVKKGGSKLEYFDNIDYSIRPDLVQEFINDAIERGLKANIKVKSSFGLVEISHFSVSFGTLYVHTKCGKNNSHINFMPYNESFFTEKKKFQNSIVFKNSAKRRRLLC